MVRGMSEQVVSYRIRIARQVANTIIEVWIDDEGQLRDGLLFLNRLCNNARVELARHDIEHVWVREGSEARIRDTVTNSVYRVALSLFESWPQSKRVLDIHADTGLVHGSVSDILAGRTGHAENWFRRQGTSWTLSDTGISKVLDEVVAAVRGGTGQELPSQ